MQELEEPGREQGSASSQEHEQTKEGQRQELDEPDRCNNYQVKEQEYREQENPGGTAHIEIKNNREFHMNGEEHGKEQATNPLKEQEQTEEGEIQELEDQVNREEDLCKELRGSELEVRKDHKLEESLKVPRKARQITNTSDAGPSRSSRLAKKRVTLRAQEETHDPTTLPYYMDAVYEGRAGRWWDRPL